MKLFHGRPACLRQYFLALTAALPLLLVCGRAAADDEADIRATWAAFTTAYNAKDLDAAMACFSLGFLDDGSDHNMLNQFILDQFADPDFQPLTYTIYSVTVAGDTATADVTTYGLAERQDWVFRKEAGVWMIYGNQRQFGLWITSRHEANKAVGEICTSIELEVDEYGVSASSVSVAGPGITGSISLHHDAANNAWVSWSLDGVAPTLNPQFTHTARPILPAVYTFTINKIAGGQVVLTGAVKAYVDVFASNLVPVDGTSVTQPLTFSWTGPGSGYTYRVTLRDLGGTEVWKRDNLGSSAPVAYDGPGLADGTVYSHSVRCTDEYGNRSMNWASFTHRAAAAPDADTVRNRFAAAINAYNRKDADGMMAFFSPNYLDQGLTFATQRLQFQNDFADPGFQPLSFSMGPVTVAGNGASATVTWLAPFSSLQPMYFLREGGVWMMYGDHKKYRADAHSEHTAANHPGDGDTRVEFSVEDPGGLASSVTVTGPGIAGSIALNPRTGGHEDWVSWGNGEGVPDVSPQFTHAGRPALPATYTFTMHEKAGGETTMAVDVTAYLDAFPSNLVPADGAIVTQTPTFSWTGLGAGYAYSIYLDVLNGGRLWSAGDDFALTGTSAAYTGPALVPGEQYRYELDTRDASDNKSRIEAIFTYNDKVMTTTAAALNYTEDSGAVALDPGVTVTDGSSTTLTEARVWFSANYAAGQDVLAFTNQNGISGAFDGDTGTLTLSGEASVAAYQTALRSVTYRNTSQNPDTLARTVALDFTDASAVRSPPATRSIEVVAVNDPPTLSAIGNLTGAGKDADFAIAWGLLAAAADEADPDSAVIAFRVESLTNGTLKKGGSAVVLGTASAILWPGENWVWHPPAGVIGVINAFQVKAWDGQAASATAVQARVQVQANGEIEVTQGAIDIVDNGPTPVAFGTAPLAGAPVELVFTIRNLGDAALDVGTVFLDNNLGFAVSQQPAGTVPASDSTTFTLRMTTDTLGAKSADVRFSNGDGDEDPFNFQVTGSVTPGLDADENGLDDAWETQYFGHTGVDPNADADGDGLSNLQEQEYGTDPTRYVLTLRQGWNLVALARIPTDHSVAAVFGNHIRGRAWTWAGDHYEAPTQVMPLSGIWVYAPADAEIPIALP